MVAGTIVTIRIRLPFCYDNVRFQEGIKPDESIRY